MNEELKPCPSCLCEAKLVFYLDAAYEIYQVKCTACPIQIAKMFNKAVVIAAWNRRVNQSGWVKCSEKLPKEFGRYLVKYCYGIDIFDYRSDKKEWFHELGHTVTYWMPIEAPQPPEQE